MTVERFVRVGICALAFALAVPAMHAADEVFISNYFGNSILVFPRTANGDVAPIRGIFTGMSIPHDLALHVVRRELFVPNNLEAEFSPSINVYDVDAGAPGEGDDPLRVITGPATELDRPAGILLDPVHGELYVANDVNSSRAAILVFAVTASGDAAPLRILKGPATGLGGPLGLALDLVHDELIVVNYKVDDGGSITTYPRTARGNAAPTRTIQGPLTGFNLPQALVLDLVHDELFVVNSYFDNLLSLGEILTFPRTGVGNIAPVRTLTGSNTGLCNPIAMLFDRVHDELFITNAAVNPACSSSVVVHARGATGNASPLRSIGPGSQAGLNSPEGVAVLTTIDCSDPLVAAGTPCDDGNVCSLGDACAAGSCTATQLLTPPEVQDVSASEDDASYTWSAAASASVYDAVRGAIGALPAGPGAGDEVCFADLPGPTLSDAAVPDPDTGFWYLVRGKNACGHGGYGVQSGGVLRVTTTCP